MTEKQLSNLKPCKPGETKNPNGRPKGRVSLSKILADLLERKINIIDPMTKKAGRKKLSEIINLRLMEKALKGDLKAIAEIWDRMEGKANQMIQHETQEMSRIVIVQNDKTKSDLEKLGDMDE